MIGGMYTTEECDAFALRAMWEEHMQKGGFNVATYDPKKKIYHNVELKAHIDSNEKHEIGDEFRVESPLNQGVYHGALVRVIHRKAQPGNPMGKWKYLVEYMGMTGGIYSGSGHDSNNNERPRNADPQSDRKPVPERAPLEIRNKIEHIGATVEDVVSDYRALLQEHPELAATITPIINKAEELDRLIAMVI